jgi:hypothetical protein
MDLTTLAKDVAVFLTPFLPYLLKAGKEAGKEAAKKIGEQFSEDTWERAKALWGKLRPPVEAKPAAQEAVKDAAVAPQDEDAQAALRLQLRKILAEDEALAAEVARLWEEAKAAGVTVIASGERSVAIGGDVSGSTIVVGDQNTVQHGKYNINIGKAKGMAIGDNARVDVNDIAEDK